MKMLTVANMCERLNICRSALWAGERDGRIIRGLRFGRCVRWDANAVERWIELGCPKQIYDNQA